MATISDWSSTAKRRCARRWPHAGITPLPGPFLDFLDPWGNRIEIIGYCNIQFTKAPHILRGMGLAHLKKNAGALKELARRAWRRSKPATGWALSAGRCA